jgi:hypothetical protein
MSNARIAPLPEDHPERRDLASLGYEVARWLEAMTLLQTRWRKQAFAAPLQAYLEHWLPRESAGSLPESFELSLRGGWLTRVPLPALSDPRWQALLHLPALRGFWIANLRASHAHHLQQRVSPAWCLDSAPLPPGSVIAGLNIGSWDELPALRARDQGLAEVAVGHARVLRREPSPEAETFTARYRRREDGRIAMEQVWRSE